MGQTTAKTVEDVLQWIETTEHHKAACFPPGAPWVGERIAFTHIILSGHHDRLRVPVAVWKAAGRLITVGAQFDTRMYRATKAGRARLRRASLTTRLLEPVLVGAG